MMVGTNKNMTTDDKGYTVPETAKFHAENCTVHFGEWNDYYYCELVANSLASYTHDHQFSRLEPIASLDEIKCGDTWKKAGNFLLISGDTKTCYHIVKKNGVLTQHKHEDAGTEVVNGETVWKEDKYCIYLPFNQLFTGYGWGVKHVPVKNGEDYAMTGVTILEQNEGGVVTPSSVTKFDSKIAANTEYTSGVTVTVGSLFAGKNDLGVKAILKDNVQVFVSPVGDKSTAGVEYKPDTTDWTKGTLTFSGTGAATITITDYYYCTPTTIEVTITERVAEEKFVTKFNGDFLYRVGNQNAVKLDSLFAAKKGATIGNVSVTVEAVNGTGASGTYTSNATWTNGTIQFSGTGVVKVTITDNDYCTPTELYLEVVDARNYESTSISSLGSGNVVLHCNTKLNTNGALALQNAALYGNGYELDVSSGRVTGESITANYLLFLNNGTLDNIRIKGAVYTEFNATSSEKYNNPVVLTVGRCAITNCEISNCASPVRIRSGQLTIEDTVLKGGSFANLDIRGGNIILKNVTTINQLGLNDKTVSGEESIGMGIVFYYEGPSKDTSLTIVGELSQYNAVSENMTAGNTYTKAFLNEVFNVTYNKYHYTDANGIKWVNTGIISLSGDVGSENIKHQSASTTYTGQVLTYKHPTMGQVDGYVYAPKGTAPSDSPESLTSAYHPVMPKVSFDHSVNEMIKQDGSETSCTVDTLTGDETITFADGDSFTWNTRILECDNKEIAYTVWLDNVQRGETITFDESGEYTITYKYTDTDNYKLNVHGEVEQYTVEYETSMQVIVIEKEALAKSAVITFPLLNSYGTTTVTVDGKTYIMPNLTGQNVPKYGDDLTFDASTRKYGSLKADGRATVDIYYPIIKTAISGNYMVFPVFGNKNGTLVQIQDYADKGTGTALTPYNASTQVMPDGLSMSRGYTVQWSTKKDTVGSGSMSYGGWTNGLPAFKYQSSSDDIQCKVMSNYLSYYPNINLRSNDRNEQVMVAEYKYVDNKGDTYYYCVGYHIEERNSGYAFGETVPESSGSCFTPDTLITLADGSQKRVDSLTGDEMLLVWNLETGAYDAAPIVFVDSEEEAEYEVIHLYFSDDTDVKVIYEHGYFDVDLGKYVYLDKDAAQYIGHRFIKQGSIADNAWEVVTLTDVVIETEVTTAWSPVTFSHLCYYTNGMLSMPGGIAGLFNIFDVDVNTMAYDAAKKQADINTYGLYTYDDFDELIPEAAYEAFNGAYLKVAIGKGMLTWGDIARLAERYVPLMPQ